MVIEKIIPLHCSKLALFVVLKTAFAEVQRALSENVTENNSGSLDSDETIVLYNSI